jgi:hypothetical protein
MIQHEMKEKPLPAAREARPARSQHPLHKILLLYRMKKKTKEENYSRLQAQDSNLRTA